MYVATDGSARLLRQKTTFNGWDTAPPLLEMVRRLGVVVLELRADEQSVAAAAEQSDVCVAKLFLRFVAHTLSRHSPFALKRVLQAGALRTLL